MQDFGALASPGLRGGTALQPVMPSGIDRFAAFALNPNSAALAQNHTQWVATAHSGEPLARHAFSTMPTAHAGSHSTGHDTADDPSGVADHALSSPTNGASSVFAPMWDPPAIVAPQVGNSEQAIATAHGFAQSFDSASHGVQHNSAPPSAGAIYGQLWFGGVGVGSDNQLGHVDGDGAARDVSDLPHVAFQNVGLDPANGLYFGITADGFLRDGHITNDQETNQASEIQAVDVTFGSGSTADNVQALAVDPLNHIIFVGLRGQSDNTTSILEVQYNPTTGLMTSPYNTSTGLITDFSHVLLHDDNNGTVNNVNFTNVTAMQYDMQNSNLYYVDQTNGNSYSGGPGSTWNATNGIYVVSTTGTVGGNSEPTPIQLSLPGQFAAGDNNNYIDGLAINEAQGIIYFAVNNASTNTSKVYWMPITGGAATQMSIPAGVTFGFANSNSTGVNPLAFDPNGRQLYVSDSSDSHLVEFTLSADGHSFSSGNSNFMTFDGSVAGSSTTGLYFDPLPTISALSATTTDALQSGGAVSLLTAAPTITDPQDGLVNKMDMGYLQVIVANAQSGDRLFYNGLQSGTFDSGKMSISWNASTHTLTLTGNETEAFYDMQFQNITFQDSGNDSSSGSHPTRTIDWIISDGTTIEGQTTSNPNEQATTVVIDRAPTLASDNYAVVESATSSGSGGTSGTGVFANDSDKDGDTFTVTAVNGSGANVGNLIAGTYGHLTLNADGSYSYAADNTAAIDAAPNGSHPVDSFTYTVSDGLGGVSTTTVTFTVDRAPTVTADNPSGEALENGSAISGNVLTNDSDKDGDSLTVSAVNGVAGNVGNSLAGTYGHITINSDGTYSYLADNTAIDSAPTGSHLTDTFSYTANDGFGGTTTTNITVTVDRAPTVVADNPATDALESGAGLIGNVLSNDSDRDGDTLTVSAVNGLAGNVGSSIAGSYGHITINSDGSYSYAADNTTAIDAAATGSHLTDTFTYTANDGLGGTTSTSITITLDRAPTVVNDSGGTVAQSGSASVNALAGVLPDDSDRDGDSLAVSAVSGSGANVGISTATTYGHIILNADGSYSYIADNIAALNTAASGSHPVDTVTFTVSDGFGGSASETLSFTIDRPASAVADSLSTAENTQAINGSGGNPNLLANDVDKDGDAVTITAVNGASINVGTQIVLASGALLTVNANGSYVYNPNHAFDYLPGAASGASNTAATDTFTYTVDGGSTVTVTVNVNGVDSNDTLIGTTGNDTIHGGIGNDIIYDDNGLSSGTDPLDTSAGHSGGADTFFGDSGNDIIFMGGNLTASDKIDGGTNTDTVVLNGDYSGGLVFNATTMVNVEDLGLTSGHSYNLTMNNATVASGRTMIVLGNHLGVGSALTFDASADTTGGRYFIYSGAGNDVLTGGHGNDYFRPGTGIDTIHGGGGNDRVNMGGALTAADSIDLGTGNDAVYLKGNYSAGLVLAATTLVGVETLGLSAGFSYNLTMNAATVAAGSTLTVGAAALASGNSLIFNGSADTAGGAFAIFSGAGNDVLTGGVGNDQFNPGAGIDTVHGGGGDDVIAMGGALTAADTIDGGAGNDTVFLNGDYSGGLTFGATTISNVERITLTAGNSYNLTIDNATVAAGQTMTLAGNNLGASDSFVFDGSHDTSGGSLAIAGGAGNDTLTGGWSNDVITAGNGTNIITGGGGSDILAGGTGADTFIYNAVSDSTSTQYDKVTNFDASADTFKIAGHGVNAIDTAIASGHLSGTSFDSDLSNAVNAAHLAAHDAVLFTADSGTLHGHTFLVVDVNGVAGYQTGQDIVIDVTGGAHLSSLSTANFVT